jgi:ferrochelatase
MSGPAPQSTIGLLLVNLGSPEAPTPEAVSPYLREFLMDPDVIDIPGILRWPLVHWLIVPRRAEESARLYEKIWTDEGSPLLVHSRAFAAAINDALRGEDDLHISLGMRYGSPGIRSALERLPLDRLERLIVFPLYPQYAQSSTLTVQKKVLEVLKSLPRPGPTPEWIEPFYCDRRYIAAVGEVSARALAGFDPDLSLFSFHGVPERHLRRLHKVCLSEKYCCNRITPANRNCYRAQCFATAQGIAAELGIGRDQYRIAFQSRLGRTPWIQPFTDHVIQELPSRGVRRLAVFCPSFVADCLETLDEIENRERERFLAAGGRELRLIPSLNAEPVWVKAAASIVRDAIGI